MRRARSLTAVSALWLAGLVAACSPHPVGPARTFASFERKATTTAESALSAVETVRLAAQAGADGNGTGPYLGQVVSEQENALSGVQGTFGSIQPPDSRADQLRAELDELMSDALEHVVDVRIAIRRGDLAGLADTAAPLAADADGLRAFAEAHR
jgi:hypothetical protein